MKTTNKNPMNRTSKLALAIGWVLGAALSFSEAATVVDLTGSIDDTGELQGAIYRPDNSSPSGTGIFARDLGGVFLSIQGTDTEEGYNTDVNNVLDNMPKTQDILYSSLNQVTIEGDLYVPFLLDINESGNEVNALITLENVTIFSSTTGGLSLGSLAALAAAPETTLLYDMDVGPDNDSEVLLNFNLVSGGSGQADMALFVPVSKFVDVNDGDHIVLYSQFSGADAGFEEWTLGAGEAIPEPSTSMLGLIGVMMILCRRVR